MRLRSIAPFLALSAVALAAPVFAETSLTLVTASQQKIDQAANALVADPAVKAARDAVVKSWSELPIASTKDGKEQLEGAVDDLVYASARDAVERNQFNPAIYWTETPPYKVGADAAPGGRFGVDTADRIYRAVSVSPSLRYVIRGQRGAQPSNRDFLIEVHQNFVSRVLTSLWAKDVDVGPDGSFVITADSTPANGRRNHLTLPEGASSLLIRDTLADWNSQLPNRLTIEVVGGAEPPHGSPEQTRAEAVANIDVFAKLNIKFLNDFAKTPANEIKLAVRGGEEGVVGNIIGVGRFSIKDDEALVATLDPQTAAYLGFQLSDPWGRSIPYWDNVSGLSNRQARKNADGTITYIVAPRDPGYANWVDTTGLHDGLATVRFEDFTKADIDKIVRQWKLVKVADLAQNLGDGAARVTPAERAAELAARKAGFDKRLTN
ncbi:hypothetical protein CCR94_05470 [Rhodoblastus sphagnicola]|uniref:DUF1214 domain-containing protein n=1 Tax=Rhodoblastus sphagnicola TaxID=333368 RepID=A0A2S6NCT1_9HYPH|nr:hypothetical protein [Rhodoblastus sphagnicola]MBB4196273.1 hypothetical protein [Rhodoblastus sphagnicola]PPQ32417.1 hypothetical protein CCR94_05470 [Rhodoblastus sphagnicola]